MSVSEGCRLFGAYRTAISVKDAAILIHSTVGCNWGTSSFHIPSRQKDIRQASSVLYEEDIVYGGNASLEKALGAMTELYDSAVVFVLTGCVAEIMEDDAQGIISAFSSQKPILLVKAAGFKGDMASGITDTMRILIDRMTERKRCENTVNIVGVFSDDYRSDADVKALHRLLGNKVTINGVLPYDSYEKILAAPAASLNVVFEGFEDAGARMEEKFGIPYVVVNYPYGLTGSRNFAEQVTEALGVEPNDSLKEQEADAVERLEMAYGYMHKLYGTPVAVSGDKARARALRVFLENELGMHVEAFRQEGRAETDPDFDKALEASSAVMVFGSSFERGAADQLGIPLIRYTYPVFDAVSFAGSCYAGFDGTVNFIEDMINAAMAMPYRRDGMYGK